MSFSHPPPTPADAGPPSELLVLSPRPETDAAHQELVQRLAPVVAPIPVRLVEGDSSEGIPPRPRAALIAGGQPGTGIFLQSMHQGHTLEAGDPAPTPVPAPTGWSWVHLTSSGPDHFLDWPFIPGNPLRTYSRGVNARTIAEWIIGAILHFHRDFGHYVRSGALGLWERRWASELEGRTMVVLGAGEAGSEAARIASALNLHTIGVSRSGRDLPGFDRVVRADHVETVWGLGDITVILLPLTPQTRGSIGAERIVRLKRGSLLLVVSRGGIVDEGIVAQAVQSGHLAGAAFDVFRQEPLPADSPLRKDSRILVTPHVAGTSDRFMERTAAIVEAIWRSWQHGEEPERLERYRYIEGGTT